MRLRSPSSLFDALTGLVIGWLSDINACGTLFGILQAAAAFITDRMLRNSAFLDSFCAWRWTKSLSLCMIAFAGTM